MWIQKGPSQLQRCLLQWKCPFYLSCRQAEARFIFEASLPQSMEKLPWRTDISAVSWAAFTGWARWKCPFQWQGWFGEGCGGQAVLPLSLLGLWNTRGQKQESNSLSQVTAFPSLLSLDETKNRKFWILIQVSYNFGKKSNQLVSTHISLKTLQCNKFYRCLKKYTLLN